MLLKVTWVFLALATLFFLSLATYLFLFAQPAHFIFDAESIAGRTINLRLIGLIFCIFMILQNVVLMVLLQWDPLKYYSLQLSLDSDAILDIKDEIPVVIDLDERIPVRLDEKLTLEVPINQEVQVRVREKVRVPVDVTAHVPIDEEVDVEAMVPIKTTIDVDTKIQTTIMGAPVKIPIKVQLPLDVEVPISCKARIKMDDFQVHVKETFELGLDEPISVHMDTILKTEISLANEIEVPLKLNLKTLVRLDQKGPIKLKGDFVLSRESVKMKIVPGSKKN